MVPFRKISLNSDVDKITGVGSILASKLRAAQVNTVRDLLYYFPFRYEDLTNVKKIIELQVGEQVSIQATLWQISKFRTLRGRTIVKATINDGSGSLEVIWFNQDYLLSVLKPNQVINFSGKIGFFGKKIALVNPSYEIVKANQALIHTQGLVPIYSQSSGLSKKFIRGKIFQLLFESKLDFDDPLPPEIVKQQKFPSLRQALEMIHFPKKLTDAIEARKRFAFEELLLLQLSNEKGKLKQVPVLAPSLQINHRDLESFRGSLPFILTNSQEVAIGEILKDLTRSKPMNRLLQGEVGSGKTVVSSFALKVCLDQGLQASFMAPTEILAKQHYKTLQDFLGKKYKIGLATSSKKVNFDSFQLLVGTHALLSKGLNFSKLGLVVIDEQQRFGVEQRNLLRKKGQSPHFLTMSATPIPRTLALTLFGDLEISQLAELPSSRKNIKTYLVPKAKRERAYSFIKKQIALGDQAYLICPLIEPSESLETVKSVTEEFEFLKKTVFKTESLGLLHGRLKSSEKELVLERFREGSIDLLVSTPVVEVGIDVPNATVVVVEAADRFGLSSLHQLRGRVGRGEKQSFCLVFTENENPKILSRLRVLQESNDGFYIAETDLRLRGAGDIYGTLQHGHVKLKLSDAVNFELISETKKVARDLIQRGLTKQLDALSENDIGSTKQVALD